MTKRVFEVVRACLTGAAGALGDAKLTEVFVNVNGKPKQTEQPLYTAAEVREEARKYGAGTMAEGGAHRRAARRLMAQVWAGLAGRRREGSREWEVGSRGEARRDARRNGRTQ